HFISTHSLFPYTTLFRSGGEPYGKMIRRKKIFLVLLIACMVLIFVFSSRPGDESAEDSSWVSMLVGEVFVPGFDEWSQAEQEARSEEHTSELQSRFDLVC